MTPTQRAKLLVESQPFADDARHMDTFALERHVAYAIAAAVEAERKAQPALTWTKEPPTVPGWWWIRTGAWEWKAQAVEVCVVAGSLYFDLFGRTIRADCAGQIWPDVEWCGPIPEPPTSPDGGKDADSYKHLPPRGNA